MGLRLSEGVDPRRFERLSGRDIDRDRVESLIEDGFLERDERGPHPRDGDGRAAARHGGGRRRGVRGGHAQRLARVCIYIDAIRASSSPTRGAHRWN